MTRSFQDLGQAIGFLSGLQKFNGQLFEKLGRVFKANTLPSLLSKRIFEYVVIKKYHIFTKI